MDDTSGDHPRLPGFAPIPDWESTFRRYMMLEDDRFALIVVFEKPYEEEAVVALLDVAVRRLPILVARARQIIADRYLTIHNERWRGDEGPVDEGSFKARLELKSLLILSPEMLEITFDDDDLFWGHSLSAAFTLPGGKLSEVETLSGTATMFG